jgi:adenylate cyclase
MHFGRVTCSNVGVAAERDATIIGDAVNTVFRLEALSKELAQRAIVSGDFADQSPEAAAFKDFGEHALKGKANMVRVRGLA